MSEQPQEQFDLTQELRQLGEQIKEALRVARDHPQTKEFEQQISQAVSDLGAEIDRAMKSAREQEHVKNLGTQVKQAVQSVETSGAAQDIERGLAKGVRALNEQIRRAIEDAQKDVQRET